jgi:type I restriction enzyme S subunit
LLDGQIEKNSFENQKLSELRDTLLPKLMSGEIEVPIEGNA